MIRVSSGRTPLPLQYLELRLYPFVAPQMCTLHEVHINYSQQLNFIGPGYTVLDINNNVLRLSLQCLSPSWRAPARQQLSPCL